MGKASEPRIKDFTSGEDFTKVTFSPDLAKFKMQALDDDIVSLMTRRAYDVAASSRGVKVFLNGHKIQIKSFKDYVDLYIKGKEDDIGNPLKVVYENCGPRWEVAVTLSDKGFQQMSFVNSIATTKVRLSMISVHEFHSHFEFLSTGRSSRGSCHRFHS